MKIAPRLRWFVETCYGGTDAQAKAQLRALLAVARAAKKCADDYEEEPYGIHRALSRLERVSGGKP